MASISNIPTNARSMNGLIVISDGITSIENGVISIDGNNINDMFQSVGDYMTISNMI